MKKLFIHILVIAGLLSLASAKEVKIGVVMPMSGPIGGFGQSANKGIELAHQLQPTLNNGDTIKIILLDNKSDKIESANAMQKLVSSDKVSAVIGALTSTNTMAITKIAGYNKTPMVAPVATNILVTKNRKYANRVCFSDAFQGQVAANFIKNELKKSKVVIITDVKQDYSIGISKVFKKAFKKMGGKVLKQVKITSGTSDFKAVISSIKSMNAELVFFPIYSAEAALIAKQAKQLGLNLPFVGTDGMTADKVFFETGGKAVEGFYNTDLYSSDAPKTTKASQEFAKAYKEKYNENVHPFAALSADSYNIIVNALNQCKNSNDGPCINEKIKSTKQFAGVSGVITIEKNGDATRSAVINQIQNGKMVYRTTVNP
ncbi:ABC transporter substrate-binding protein [Arcobacteraceae bacterium]|nr:ABC transporter substrate-binding protein [Arcobacteraceae bacterium]